jgi:cyclopropane fatty-acyl-phospholipid synthase-like methyltransferase
MNEANKQSFSQADKWFASDLQFHKLYPEQAHGQSSMHWTPLHIARKAAEFLAAEKNSKILDIGSGAGKFCLTAAYYQPEAFFYGVEQRAELVQYAEAAADKLGLQNAFFSHTNITEVDFRLYDHFYFFNAFYDNLDSAYRIDEKIPYSKELYTTYNRFVYKQLEKKPGGTRLATFHSMEDEIPTSFYEVASTEDNLLKFWTKVY